MYEAFYGLREKPFNLTPDPRFLYLSEKHREAFAHLLFGIKNRNGFVMVTGEIGTGKTTICRTLVKKLDEDTEVAFIFNPCLSPEELLLKINEDFGISSRAQTIKDLIDELNEYLLDRAARGKNCVLVIDEAQDLTPSVLEQIRLLSNLETETQKMLQIVLVGQPELVMSLELPELRQLNQRITARYHLKPLNYEETLQYIAYRLRVAGGRGKVQFSRSAIRQIYRFSGGTPRVINAVCDRALLVAYTKEVRFITKSIVKRAVKEIRGERIARRKRLALKRFLPSPGVVSVALLLVLAMILMPALRERRAPGPAARSSAFDTAPEWLEPADVEPAKVIAKVEESLPIQPVAAPEHTADPFARLLADVHADVTRNAAAVSILRAWDMALLTGYPRDNSVSGLIDFAGENGFVGEVLYPDLDQLTAIDLPAFVKLAGDNASIWVGVLGVDDEEVRISAAVSEVISVQRHAFEERYLRNAVVLWRDPDPDAAVLKADMKGARVRALQEELRALGRLDAEPSGVYDAATIAAVRAFQQETGLIVDGIVGKQTRMALASLDPNIDTPSLRPLPAVEVPSSARAAESQEEQLSLVTPLDPSGIAQEAPLAIPGEERRETVDVAEQAPVVVAVAPQQEASTGTSEDSSVPGQFPSPETSSPASGISEHPGEGPQPAPPPIEPYDLADKTPGDDDGPPQTSPEVVSLEDAERPVTVEVLPDPIRNAADDAMPQNDRAPLGDGESLDDAGKEITAPALNGVPLVPHESGQPAGPGEAAR